jgi:hypothetical protein
MLLISLLTLLEDVVSLQEYVYSKYYDLTRTFNWNDDHTVPILPAIHGTEEPIAEKIAQTGYTVGITFASLSFFVFRFFLVFFFFYKFAFLSFCHF